MINKTYDKLFKFLLEKRLVALGLYRLPGATDNQYPYVCTNPVPHITITLRDRVFVLGNHIPRELIVENKSDNMAGNPRRGEDGAGGAQQISKNKWNSFMQ
mmetsp:Transcript_27907/g.37272  ORF Transcript_27907/g.37272 Transcript_27907/m.37272 type:complete len:101 (+) Transcript_27907:853-1155(+)